MRLQVVHETHYRYASPVVLSQQLLHLTPRVLPWQVVHSHRVTVDPGGREFDEHEDYYGNRTVHLLLATPHEELIVHAQSDVDVAPREKAALACAAGAVGDRCASACIRPAEPPLLEPAAFLYESPHIETWREIHDYAAKSFGAAARCSKLRSTCRGASTGISRSTRRRPASQRRCARC
jgi:transglutaminase-like putative cysteine protease